MATKVTDKYTTTTAQVDAEAARKAREAGAAADALAAWKADNAELLARADAVRCDWYADWRTVPNEHRLARLVQAVEEREAREAADEARKASATPVPAGRTTTAKPS